MLQELDQQQRAYEERRRIAEQDHGPTFEQVVMAVLQTVDLDDQEDVPTASTPEQLVAQTRSLLEAKGEMTKPAHETLYVVHPDEHDYLGLPFGVEVGIGGRDVEIFLQEPSMGRSRDKYYFGVGLNVGNDYFQMSQALTISKSGVSFTDGKPLTVPNNVQRISWILTKADRALLSKVQ